MDPITLVLFVLGLLLLVVGAEALVRGAARLAAAFGVSPLVIGLTVVAYGTSSPELAVSVQSALSGQADIALGNVVGSNVFNVLFILGASAMITPLVVSQQLVRRDVPVMIAVSALSILLAFDGTVGRLDGLLLFGGAIGYTYWTVRESRFESAPVQKEYDESLASRVADAGRSTVVQIGLVTVGLALLVLGSRWLVAGAVAIARMFAVSELVIGLTIIAAGTSLPEVATSIIASVRGERDIAVGNVVGSNIFNLLAVLGLSGAVAREGLAVPPAVLRFDIPVMLAVALACLPIFFTGNLIARWEGGLFLAYYAAYTLYLVMAAVEHDALPVFSLAMMAFVIPISAITLIVLALRARA